MEISNAPTLVDLQPGDEAEAMELSTETGWNQIEADWRHFIVHGRTIGYRSNSGQLLATAAALPYDGPFGFIGMVIVTGAWRRRGLATALVDKCLAELRSKSRVPVLDATEQGELVYTRQGFVPQFRFDRWEISGSSDAPLADVGPVDSSLAAKLDGHAFGAFRPALLAEFMARSDSVTVLEGSSAFGLIRRGRRACQVGPVVAEAESDAIRILEKLVSSGQAVFIDVPRRWTKIGGWLSERGFRVQRSFARMALGRAEPFGSPERLFAVAGPEFG